MGSKNKLKRFRENETFKHVIQPLRDEVLGGFYLKGEWYSFFGNKRSIVLELGCGKGEYTVELARRNPDKNFIGVDIKGARFWRGAKTVEEEQLKNVAFLRIQIELIDWCFAANEVEDIWITFPDPQIQYKRTKHRLTNPIFLNKYQSILKPNGVVHLKTDSEYLHGYTLGLLQGLGYPVLYANHDIYHRQGAPDIVMDIQTFYEEMFLETGKSITYLKFKFPSSNASE